MIQLFKTEIKPTVITYKSDETDKKHYSENNDEFSSLVKNLLGED